VLENMRDGDQSPASEIATLISDILSREGAVKPMYQREAGPHPASAILAALENGVEANARMRARDEIDALASEIKLAAHAIEVPDTVEAPIIEAPVVDQSDSHSVTPSANPFAPQPEPPAPVIWIGDAIKAQNARDVAATTWSRMAAYTAGDVEEEAQEEGFAAEAEPAPVLEPVEDETVIPLFGYRESEPRYEKAYEELAPVHSEEITRAPAPALAAAGGGNGWFGHSPEGLPVWLTSGVPVAAVSVFALGFLLMERPANIDPNFPSSDVTDVTATDLSGQTAATLNAAVPAAVAPAVDVTSNTPNVTETAVRRTTSAVKTPEVVNVVPVSQTQPVSAVSSASSALSTVPASTAKSNIATEDISLASAPSLKPQNIAARASARQVASFEPSPVTQAPRRSLPVRMFTGPIEAGSAAELVNALAQQSGPTLSKSEKVWLARDMERVLDNEIDGRTVSLKSRQGQRVQVLLKTSGQVQREFSITRVNEIAALPHDMVLEGGWYAARRDVMLHSTPALNSGLSHRVVKRDALIERMATYTDRYGDRWYLMGQRGLAVGFVSAGDVALAATHKAAFGDVYAAPRGARVHEMRTVYTRCRNGFIGPEGGLVQELKVCRDAKGHWVSHSEGDVQGLRADLTKALQPEIGTASAIVLAKATGDPVAVHAFGNRKFRRRVQGDFVYARSGQTTEHVLPDGDLIRFTFGDRYQQEGIKPVVRVEALGAFPSRLQIKAGWMKAPIGAKLRARPDILSQADLGEIPAGRSVETLGFLQGVRGGDWALVGRSGVGFGYVPVDKLAAIEGRVSPYAIANVHTREIAELVDTVTTCRTVQYETVQGMGSFDACQQADASWALKAEPEVRRQFADTPSRIQTAP